MEELKPCPFCSGTNIYIFNMGNDKEDSFVAECIDCESSSGYAKTKQEAIKKWNRRD